MDEEEARLHAAAAAHYGILTRRQAHKFGLTNRQIQTRVAAGRWTVVHPGVYRITGAPVTGRQRAYAACEWLGPEALVSHATAAALLRLPGPRPNRLHVTVPECVRNGQRESALTIHRSGGLQRTDRFVVDDIPCTSATLTVLQLAPELDDESLETMFERGRRLGLTSVPALVRRAPDFVRRPGIARIERLVKVVADRPLESKLEVKARTMLRRYGIAVPAVQHAVGRYRLDFAWPLLLIAVECDGFEWHGNRLAWKRDRRRIAALEAQGWRIVHLTWDDVTQRPSQSIARIQLALAQAA